MYDPKVHVGVAAVLLNTTRNGDEVLMVKRGPHATHGAGTWALPGGWIDWGEQPEMTAARELREECNVFVLPTQGHVQAVFSNTYDDEDMHIVCVCISFDRFDDTFMKNMEPKKHDDVRWVPFSEVHGLDLFPATKSWADLRV